MRQPEMDLITKGIRVCPTNLIQVCDYRTLALSLTHYKNFKIMLESFGTDYEMLHKELKAYVEQLLLYQSSLTPTYTRTRTCYEQSIYPNLQCRRHLQTIDLFLSIMKEERSLSLTCLTSMVLLPINL